MNLSKPLPLSDVTACLRNFRGLKNHKGIFNQWKLSTQSGIDIFQEEDLSKQLWNGEEKSKVVRRHVSNLSDSAAI